MPVQMPLSTIRKPQARLLPDGRRWHISDGPIDLIVEASGAPDAVARSMDAAICRMTGLLDGLCEELPRLRHQARPGAAAFADPVARRMAAAVAPYANATFITPMAAVAGSVADAVIGAMVAAAGGLTRAYVNNGGDIAIFLASGERYTTGLVTRPDAPGLFATVTLHVEDGIGGIATSGAPGRSFSLGIADAVTILARNAASADAAATIVANAVDLPGDERIKRVPAKDLQPDSDLGVIPVTRFVPRLDEADKGRALQRGVICAQGLIDRGLIAAAALYLQGEARFVGAPHLIRTPKSQLIGLEA